MADKIDRPDFDELYRDERSVDGLPALTPWDIGEPQPVVQQLVAYGAVRGEVLDPGTGPGHNAIYYAAKGYATTGIDSSPAAIERAKANAERAGVSVNFEVADATKLEGLENRFDTVIDSAFYHVLFEDEETQQQYLQALRRATMNRVRGCSCSSSGATTSMAWVWEGLPADNFERLLPASGVAPRPSGDHHLPGTLQPRGVRGDVLGSQPRAGREDEGGPGAARRDRALAREPSGTYAVLGRGGHPPRLGVTGVRLRGSKSAVPISLCGEWHRCSVSSTTPSCWAILLKAVATASNSLPRPGGGTRIS